MTSAPSKPFWLLPNLLSLDAPLVAVVWLTMFARTWGVSYHPGHSYLVLALGVWVLYVADRLLDASLHGESPRCQARHQFHRRHWRKFVCGALIAAIAALATVLMKSPMAIFSYLIVEGILVAGFFGFATFGSAAAEEVPYAKNILAGAAFAFGTALVAHVYLYDKGIRDLLFSREFIAFAVLCILNISAIDLWEHAARSADPEVRATDELSLTLPLTLLGMAALFFALQAQQHSSRPFFYSILTGAALLHILNRNRERFSTEALRVLADCALVAPALVFFSFPSA